MTLPLVSVVTPTRNRTHFLERCAFYLQRQTYPRLLLEWVIVDSSEEPSAGTMKIADRVKQHVSSVQVCRVLGSLGHLHNVGNRSSRGSVIVHFDDDDWHSPTRIEKQVTALMRPGIKLVCTDDYFTWFGAGRACKSWSWGMDLFSSGGTFAYWRSAWERNAFPALQHGEDQVFAKMIRIAGGARNLRDPTLFAYIRHGANTCEFLKDFEDRANHDDHASLARLMGEDRVFYEPEVQP